MTVTLDEHDAEQEQLREGELHAGCFTVAEATGIVKVKREAIRHAIVSGQLTAHRAPNQTGRTAAWHIESQSLRQLYVRNKRRRKPGAGRKPAEPIALTQEQAAELLADTIRQHTTEWDQAKEQNGRQELTR